MGTEIDVVLDLVSRDDEVDNVLLNGTQERLLRELRNNPNLTQPQLKSIIGLGESAIQNNISFLKKNGYIERVGANKRGYWRIKE